MKKLDNKMEVLKPTLLEEITRRIVGAFNPEKIILYGSYAYGIPCEGSDIDLFIIMKTGEKSTARRARAVSKVLYSIPAPIDIIIYTPEEMEKRRHYFSPFLKDVLGKGKVLYENR